MADSTKSSNPNKFTKPGVFERQFSRNTTSAVTYLASLSRWTRALRAECATESFERSQGTHQSRGVENSCRKVPNVARDSAGNSIEPSNALKGKRRSSLAGSPRPRFFGEGPGGPGVRGFGVNWIQNELQTPKHQNTQTPKHQNRIATPVRKMRSRSLSKPGKPSKRSKRWSKTFHPRTSPSFAPSPPTPLSPEKTGARGGRYQNIPTNSADKSDRRSLRMWCNVDTAGAACPAVAEASSIVKACPETPSKTRPLTRRGSPAGNVQNPAAYASRLTRGQRPNPAAYASRLTRRDERWIPRGCRHHAPTWRNATDVAADFTSALNLSTSAWAASSFSAAPGCSRL